MNRFLVMLVSLLVPIASTLSNVSFAQTKVAESTASSGEPNQLPFDMASSWRMTVRRDGRAQLVQIPEGINRDSTQKFLLNTISTFTKGELVKISAEMIETGQARILVLTPATGNKITVLQSKDGNFEGALATTNGQILNVQIQKLTEKEISEIAANLTSSRMQSAIKLSGPDVPAECASLVGGWTGHWGVHGGEQWLWVVEVDTNCVAKYQIGRKGYLGPFESAEIREGVLSTAGAEGGTIKWSRHGDELWASYSGPSGRTNAVHRKIKIETK